MYFNFYISINVYLFRSCIDFETYPKDPNQCTLLIISSPPLSCAVPTNLDTCGSVVNYPIPSGSTPRMLLFYSFFLFFNIVLFVIFYL